MTIVQKHGSISDISVHYFTISKNISKVIFCILQCEKLHEGETDMHEITKMNFVTCNERQCVKTAGHP